MKSWTKGRMLALAAALGLAGLALALAVTYRKAQTLSAERRAEIAALRRNISHLDSELARVSLEARYGRIHQYDGLVRVARDLDDSIAQWSRAVSEVVQGEDAARLEAPLSDLADVAKTQRSDLERFKSTNSVLKNSLRYLPRATFELAQAAEAIPSEEGLRRQASQVALRTFMFGAFRGREHLEALTEALTGLELEVAAAEARSKKLAARGRRGERQAAAIDSVVRRAKLVDLHGKTSLREIQTVEQALEALRARPLEARAEAVDDLYQRALTHMEARAGTFRGVLYALTGVLFVLLLAVGYGLRRLYATLEERVRERTRSLSEAHASLSRLYQSNRLVLENVSDGLLTVSLSGELGAERAAIIDRWFGAPRAGESMQEWLERHDPTFAAYLRLGLEELLDDLMPREVVVAQLPSTLTSGESTFRVEYLPIESEGGELTHLLVSIRDITEQLARQREEARQREIITLAQRVGADRGGAIEFLEETRRLLKLLRAEPSLAVQKRILHTIKGNTAIFGLQDYSGRCHDLEEVLAERGSSPTEEEISALEAAWAELRSGVQPFLGEGKAGTLEVRAADLAELKTAIGSGASPAQLLSLLDGWAFEALEVRFERIAGQLTGIAQRLGKKPPVVRTEARGLRQCPEQWRDFWSALSHVLRNAMDHGIEGAEERLEAGKPVAGEIRLFANVVGTRFVVGIADDGRGLDWDTVRARAQSLGLPAETTLDLIEALFHDGLSTKAVVSDVSGRGVGLGAVRMATEARGGKIDIESEPGEGTRFLFSFPLESVCDSVVVAAA